MLAAAAVSLATGLAMAGCGGGDSSSELVRIHAQDTLDFRMDSSDGPEHVFPVDRTWVVTRDGIVTETGAQPGPGRSKTVDLSTTELKRIKGALGDLDLDALEHRFGTEKEGDGTTVVTYGGRTVTLDSRVMASSLVDEAPRVARPFGRLTVLLTTLLEEPRDEARHGQAAAGGADPLRKVHRVLRRQTRQMKRAMRRRSCEDTKKLVTKLGASRRQARQIYSQIRDQPCP